MFAVISTLSVPAFHPQLGPEMWAGATWRHMGATPETPQIKPGQILALFGVGLAWASRQQPLVQRDVISSLHNEMKPLSSGPLLHRTVDSPAKAWAPTWSPLTEREREYSRAFIYSLNRYRWTVCPVSGAALEPGLQHGGSVE